MNLFKKIFAPKNPLEGLRKAVGQKRWADALVEGDLIERQGLPPEDLAELENLLLMAGNTLAAMNLEEGEALLRAGEPARAREHFSLAADQAHDPRLRERAREHLASPAETSSTHRVQAACCPTGCADTVPRAEAMDPAGSLDVHTHLDLLLSAYPPDLAARYARIEGPFLEAFLNAHEGKGETALAHFAKVPAEQRGDLFYFERGALLARSEQIESSAADLEQALAINPQFGLARQLLVSVYFALGREEAGKSQLLQMLQEGKNPGFAHGQLAAVLTRAGDAEQGLQHALRALEYGGDPETCLLAASLLEKANRLAEAEGCLARLAAPGCGSVNPYLAEFWLRHGKHPERALEIFKGALRQEPGNSRWRLRIAQTYLACGWRRESLSMLNALLDDPEIDPHLRQEAVAALEQCR